MREYQRRGIKTSDEQVKEALRLYHEEGWSQGRIARHLGIAAVTVGRYVRGESRRDVSGDPVADHALPGPAPEPEAISESIALLAKLIDKQPEEDEIAAILRRRSQPKEKIDETDRQTGETDREPAGGAEQAPPSREPGGA